MVRDDMDGGSMDVWMQNGMQRANLITQLHGSWAQQAATTIKQKQILRKFIVDFRTVCNMSEVTTRPGTQDAGALRLASYKGT